MNELSAITGTGKTLFARLMVGLKVIGSNITISESSTPGYYTGSIPVGTIANTYTVLIFDNSTGNIIAGGQLFWDGNGEIATANYINELHLLHGLKINQPLIVTGTTRSVSNISQSISTNTNDTVVSRV